MDLLLLLLLLAEISAKLCDTQHLRTIRLVVLKRFPFQGDFDQRDMQVKACGRNVFGVETRFTPCYSRKRTSTRLDHCLFPLEMFILCRKKHFFLIP